MLPHCTRRDLLAAFLGIPAALAAGCRQRTPPLPDGEIVGPSLSLGHRLRSALRPGPPPTPGTAFPLSSSAAAWPDCRPPGVFCARLRSVRPARTRTGGRRHRSRRPVRRRPPSLGRSLPAGPLEGQSRAVAAAARDGRPRRPRRRRPARLRRTHPLPRPPRTHLLSRTMVRRTVFLCRGRRE